MARYRKKPIEIEAERFDPASHPWPKGVVSYTGPDINGDCPSCGRGMHRHAVVKTMEGVMVACPGDMIITGVAGEVYPCKPEIFEQSYEEI